MHGNTEFTAPATPAALGRSRQIRRTHELTLHAIQNPAHTQFFTCPAKLETVQLRKIILLALCHIFLLVARLRWLCAGKKQALFVKLFDEENDCEIKNISWRCRHAATIILSPHSSAHHEISEARAAPQKACRVPLTLPALAMDCQTPCSSPRQWASTSKRLAQHFPLWIGSSCRSLRLIGPLIRK